MSPPIRVGLIGVGRNMRARHIPGLRAIAGVELVAACNRRPGSTAAAAREFGIPRTFERWLDLVDDPDIDAVVIGTWPYLHCPITLAALERRKHVLTEARLSMNAAEAHRMLAASRQQADLVAQVVPSPYGLRGSAVMEELIDSGYLGELREVQVYHLAGALADPAAPLSWRQDATLSGFNMLTLGIVQETLLHWGVPPPVQVMAQAHAFVPARIDPESGVRRSVGTPDSVQVLAILENGARATYQFSGVTTHGQGMGVRLFGSDGVLFYDLEADRLWGASRQNAVSAPRMSDLAEIPIAEERARTWRVEADFIDAIRHGVPIRFTEFATGVQYMEFTEAVARSAQNGLAIELPLDEFKEAGGEEVVIKE